MPTIEIKAIDTLFFRDGKPFEMEDDSWAEGIFPPPTSVIKGAIRSAYFTEHPHQMDLTNQDGDPTKTIQITNVFIKSGKKILIPAPLDYVYDKNQNKEDRELFHLKIIEKKHSEIICNSLMPYLPFFQGNVAHDDLYFIDKEDFENHYRNNDFESTLYPIHFSSMLQTESKIGVGLNKQTRSSKEGRLFRVGMNRLNQNFNEEELSFTEETTLVVEYNFDFVPKLIKLGAENKTALVKETTILPKERLEQKNASSSFFKIVLSSPAVFELGWKPNIASYLSDIKIELKCAFVGKPLSIGGWDIAARQPKKMYKAVPAGSVFYYEITNGKTLQDVQKALNNTHFLSDFEIDMGTFEIAALNFEQLKIQL